MSPPEKETDVLVIGAGLAGFRAAATARQSSPSVRVTIVCPSSTPSGSSFLNRHNKLGIQVCHSKEEEVCFIKEALSIAPPGKVDPDLVRILARESLEAFKGLQEWGAKIQRDAKGDYLRVRGCFSPLQPRAYILLDMHGFYFRVKEEVLGLGVEFMAGWQAEKILKTEESGKSRVIGALIRQGSKGKRLRRIHARAIILACGGMTYKFRTRLSGTGKASLNIHNWCEKNGVRYINKEFTQFVWCRAEDFQHWDIANLAANGAGFRDRYGKFNEFPDYLLTLFDKRNIHAPVSYGFDDRAIDDVLMKKSDKNGRIDVYHPDTGWTSVVLAAQVSNGGIRIDEYGSTGVPGLLACGECAGGMHGANRIGGAMVLAGQVFGKRAGIEAARQVYC